MEDTNDSVIRSLEQLPREVRDRIYQESLVSADVIIVSDNRKRRNLTGDEEIENGFEVIHESTMNSLSGLSVNILKTNAVICKEASAVFYAKNTFAFRGAHEWRPIISWLEDIGEKNRRHLNKLAIDIREPSWAWQWEDGRREGMDDDFVQYDYASPVPEGMQPPPNQADGKWPEGVAEDINPNIESVFQIIGADSDAPKMQLYFCHEFAGFPGAMEDPDDTDPIAGEVWRGMDMPNCLEYWRVKHGSPGQGKREIENLWIDRGSTGVIDLIGDQLKQAGWEILSYKETMDEVVDLRNPSQTITEEQIHFTMKRRPLDGPLTHDGVNGYGAMYNPSDDYQRWPKSWGPMVPWEDC